MTGVSGEWRTTIHLDASPAQVQNDLEFLLSPRTMPPSAGYRPPTGIAGLVAFGSEEALMRYAWQRQGFAMRSSATPSETGGTQLSLRVQPEVGNAVGMGLVGVGVAALTVASLTVLPFAIVGLPFAFLWGGYAWWLARESPKHAVRAAEALLVRLRGARESEAAAEQGDAG